jgi:osmotically-inducible protein OsmY
MQARNGKVILMIYVVLSVGLMPIAWTGCISTSTRESADEYFYNSSIVYKVKAAFYHDSRVPYGNITVESWKGEVSLSGYVDSAEQITAAIQDAAKIEGVMTIHNNLVIKAH